LTVAAMALAGVWGAAAAASAQDEPPPIPFVVVDVHANVPRFTDDAQLAGSRNLSVAELPGAGFGGDLGVHIYPFKWRAITFGLGGQLTIAQAHQGPDPSTNLRAVTERLTSVAPQVSFNFGSGTGWSYLSGGVSVATWSVVPDGFPPTSLDEERHKTINYGGGARWFMKPHLAFSFDVRFYAINPGTPIDASLPGSPRATLMVIGAGISLK
jgi:hypothetical protein